MDPSIVAALGGAAVNQGSSLLDGYLTRRYNERQIDKQWARSLEQWNRENAYNHPAAVIARLKSAGINPALAYMNGASFAPAATSPTPEANHSQKLFQPQLDPMMAANVRLAEAQARDLNASAEQKEQKLPEEVNILRQTMDNMKKQSEEIQARIANMSFDNQVKAATAVSIDKTWRMHEREIDAHIDEMRAVARHYGVLDNLTNREIWERTMTWSYRLAGLDLSNKEIASRVGLNQAMTNTEWFKQVNLQSLTNLNGLDYNNRVLDGVLKTFDINARAVENRANLTDLQVMENAFGAAIGYGLHVTGKIVSQLSPKIFGK